MGLLSDPEYGSVKWVRVLKKIHKPLCIVCYIGAIVWFAMLGYKEFNNETYFSENALLPGLVTNEFNGEYAAKQFYNDFILELQDKYEDSDDMPIPWLVGKMSQLHLEVYTHNFTLKYPMGHGQVFKGTNVYGILRAARTPSLEAVVVSAPFRSLGSHQKGTTAGIALMLAFAQFARPQKYWAKDIIFLVTEHEQLGMQAWLEAYHGLQSNTDTFYDSLGSFWKGPALDFGKVIEKIGLGNQKCLNPGTLRGRSGSIQAAINLEIHDPKIKYIEVKIEGLNGQLPNLDLVNLVHKLCVKSGIHHSYKNSFSWIHTRNKMEEWVNNLWTMLGMVSTQIAGVPNGNHGLFHRFGIEAVTLEGRDATDPAGSPPRARSLASVNFYRLGAALESILRSLNNLLERFHQSYFFYMLAATNRFISIGQYMPCLCLPCVAMLIRALSLWVSIQQDPEIDDDKPKSVKHKRKAKTSESDPREQGDRGSDEVKQLNEDSTLRHRKKNHSEGDVSGDEKLEVPPKYKAKVKTDEAPLSIINIGVNYFIVHLIGYGVMNSPTFFSYIGAIYYELPSETAIFYGLIAMSVTFAFIVPFLLRMRVGRISREELSLVNILVLIELSTVCLTIGMQNFSLGLAVAALYTPVALVAGIIVEENTWKSSVLTFLRRAFCLLFHPLLVVFVGMFVYAGALFPEEELLQRAGRAMDAHAQAIMFAIVDSMIYGNWLFNVASSTLLPIWLIFWQIVCNRVKA